MQDEWKEEAQRITQILVDDPELHQKARTFAIRQLKEVNGIDYDYDNANFLSENEQVELMYYGHIARYQVAVMSMVLTDLIGAN